MTTTASNSLTAAIVKYINMTGGHAERVNNYSRTVRNRYGKNVYIPSAGMKGTADIHACINGKFVAIEIKINDSQSIHQKIYQESIEKSGGIYLIIRNLDTFIDWYSENETK